MAVLLTHCGTYGDQSCVELYFPEGASFTHELSQYHAYEHTMRRI